MILLRIKTVRLLYGASDTLFKLGSAMHDRVREDMAAAGVTGAVDPAGLLKIQDTHGPATTKRDDDYSSEYSSTRNGIAAPVLLASLIGVSIALTWLWFVVRAMG